VVEVVEAALCWGSTETTLKDSEKTQAETATNTSILVVSQVLKISLL
jgi:hypothetical protein